MGGLVVWVGIESTGWGIASVITQPQRSGGVWNTIGRVIEASAREGKSKTRYKGNFRHGLPQFGRSAPFLLHVGLANIVQRVTGVRGMGVEAAKIYSKDGWQEVPVDVMMRSRATGATNGPASNSLDSACA